MKYFFRLIIIYLVVFVCEILYTRKPCIFNTILSFINDGTDTYCLMIFKFHSFMKCMFCIQSFLGINKDFFSVNIKYYSISSWIGSNIYKIRHHHSILFDFRISDLKVNLLLLSQIKFLTQLFLYRSIANNNNLGKYSFKWDRMVLLSTSIQNKTFGESCISQKIFLFIYYDIILYYDMHFTLN